MRAMPIAFIAFLLFNPNTYGQYRTITGRIIDEFLNVVSQAQIRNSDSANIGLTDLDVILMHNGTYDYMSLKKVDKIRIRRFKKLPKFV